MAFNFFKRWFGNSHRSTAFLIPRTAGLTADEAHVENDFASKLEMDLDGHINCYFRKHGKVLNTDDAKLLCRQYAAEGKAKSYVTRMMCKYSRSAYAPAKALINEMFNREMKRDFVGRVLFLAGGPGSGKSVLNQMYQPSMDEADLIIDGTFSNLELAQNQVTAALTAGKYVDVIYVHCPIPTAVERALKRAIEIGRPVSIEVMAKSHFQAQEVFLKLVKENEANKRFSFAVVDNSKPPSDSSKVDDPSQFLTVQKYPNLDAVRNLAHSRLTEILLTYEKSQTHISPYLINFFRSEGRAV